MADEIIPAISPGTQVVPAPAAPIESVAVVPDPSSETAARAEIDALAQSFGYNPTDFAEFKDAASAKAAIKFAVENAASRSYSAPLNEPADRFSKPTAQSEPTVESVPQWKSIDYKSLGLDDDDAAAKALRLQEKHLEQIYARMEAAEKRAAKDQAVAARREEQAIMNQADEVISGFASPRYGTGQHRTRIQEMQMNKLIEMAGVIRQNSGHTLPLKACLNQARLLDEGTVAAANASLPAKKLANSELPQGGSPSLNTGVAKMKMTEIWSQNPEVRAKLGLD